jgi:hypothetical protein
MSEITLAEFPEMGPPIDFASLPNSIREDQWDTDWPAYEAYKDHIFYELPEWVTDVLCGLTHRYLWFSTLEYCEYGKRNEIDGFVANLLKWASYIAECPDFYFQEHLSCFYEGSKVPIAERTPQRLKNDLLETLMSLSKKCLEVKEAGRYLGVIGP